MNANYIYDIFATCEELDLPDLTVALAPILTFGVLFAAILPLVPQGWFWVVYLLQVINLSGAAGDLFVTVRFARLPKDIAVRDCGVSMTVYSKSEG